MLLGLGLIALFLILLVFRVPIAFCMLLTSLFYVFWEPQSAPTFVPQAMVRGAASYLVLAVPFFMLVGELMNNAGITRRIFAFADACVGHITGGLGHVNIVASCLFAGVSGSAAADAAGLGNVKINAMKEKGFDVDFAVGITAASSTIGPILPPSGPMVLFGIMTGASIGSLFLGGIFVGLLMALFMMFTVYWISRKRNYPRRERASLRELWTTFKDAFWALLTPIILIGGIVGGLATPTEVAAFAVVYALFLGFFVYRELSLRTLKRILTYAVELIGMILLLIAAGTVFAWMLGRLRVAENLGTLLFTVTENPILILIIINLFLLFLGTFMETSAALLITIPVIMPIVAEIGMDPIQFGVVMILVLMLGLITPPMAICLFITARIGGISFGRAVRAVMPYYIAMLVVIILVNAIPALTLWIPRLFYG